MTKSLELLQDDGYAFRYFAVLGFWSFRPNSNPFRSFFENSNNRRILRPYHLAVSFVVIFRFIDDSLTFLSGDARYKADKRVFLIVAKGKPPVEVPRV